MVLKNDKKARLLITLDKSIYFFLKQRNVKISSYINQLLKVALNSNAHSFCGSAKESDYRAHNPEVGGSNPPPAKNFF